MSDLGLEMKVLLKIAQGTNTFYALTVKEKIGSNEGVLNALGRLVLKKYVEKGPVGARNSQPYLLMEDGFDLVIRRIDKINDFDSFVTVSKTHFPLVFNYWSSLGKHDLQYWVVSTLTKQMPVIDAAIVSQLMAGDRKRYSHEEFINDLYDRVYGPWFTVDDWDEFVVDVPIDRIRAFLKDNPEVLKSRELACDRNRILVRLMMNNTELYHGKILGFE